VASLLEVGTGFHPELTGRENIFVNGSILGMKRREIRENFDAIVDFAGTERFLDTPLKYYSSGMQLRLAFAVAAFLSPEILIIDEVLAVGDAEFQKKCIGKMQEVAGSGRTILFVSHNLAAVERLCSAGVLLEGGRVMSRGPVQEVVAEYTRSLEGLKDSNRITNLKYVKGIHLSSDGQSDSPPYMGCDLGIHLRFESVLPLEYPVLGVFIHDETRTPLLAVNNKHYVGNLVTGAVRSGVISVVFERLPLYAGHYSIDVFFGNAHEDLEIVHDSLRFQVGAVPLTQSGSLPEQRYNKVFVEKARWSYKP
jgi:lipopolysaccharide transport system ATP-binding protein